VSFPRKGKAKKKEISKKGERSEDRRKDSEMKGSSPPVSLGQSSITSNEVGHSSQAKLLGEVVQEAQTRRDA
jgi:hypothetical protein